MKWCGNWNAGVVIALAIGVVWALVEAGAFGAEADGRIVVGTEGTGAPVVFVPGLMSSPDVYDAAIAGLTEAGSGGVTIHKAGLAGMGGTPPVADPALEAMKWRGSSSSASR